MRTAPRTRRDQAHLVTEARPGLSDDIRYRERRYLIMMGIRTVCFIAAVLMFVNHLGWLTAIPAVGALVIPYFAVVFANGGREPTANRGFRQYEPNSPAIYKPPARPGSPPRPPAE
ncbi:MAG TPA: DUF3099 domain-containing protein [Streptosporangiaceae bacterium]|nr:DUF3099 domain-containing protein [Streptosporangiaceae bacterium]